MNFAQMLMELLNPQQAQQAGQGTPPPAINRPIPIPTPRPQEGPSQATLPGGTFAPGRMPNPPIPTPRPETPGGVPVQVPQAPQMPQRPQNPLAALLMGGGAGGDWRRMIRAAGSGMANVGNTGGDMFRSFGQGFGGATGYYDTRDQAAAKAKMTQDELAYAHSKDAADLELRKAAEARLAKSSDLQNQKTAAELKRLAKQNGLTINQMLEIERIAQAAGEQELNPSKRRDIIEKERERLMKQYGSGEAPRTGVSGEAGISGKPGLSGMTATGPNGEKIVLQNGEWVPVK